MGEHPRPRRTPGGALPPRFARPHPPATNGHTPPAPQPQPPAPPRQPLGRVAWQHLDAEDEQRLEAERTAFRRVADVLPEHQVRSSGRPSLPVILGVLLVITVIVLAVVLYRLAPP